MLQMVRDGRKVVPTCPECYCRLNTFKLEGLKWAHHFAGDASSRDAKGHLCSSIGKVWMVDGK